MSAKSRWYHCGVCGFRNHPRPGHDDRKCEQCGHDPDSQDPKELEAAKNDFDYTPGA